MANEVPRRRSGSLIGALLLITIGTLILASNLLPEWDVWPFMSRYWPVILIIWGLGRLWDALRAPDASGAGTARGGAGGIVAIVLLVCFIAVAATRGRGYSRAVHETQSVDAQGAESVAVSIQMPAGQLHISGGATKLMDADFDYNWAEGKPQISYNPSGKDGRLTLTQNSGARFRREHNYWDLRMNGDVVSDLHIEMGAGKSDLRLGGMRLKRVTVEMGAGECIADLTGDWKQDVDVKIAGGAGSATVRLPKGVGVRARAGGALGSIDVRGLRRENGYYLNDAYGKSPVTLNVDVQGAVGEIRLIGD
jgi:N-terminal domain of toast_rack, DUF2154/Domain of unknown function (DUF5668)